MPHAFAQEPQPPFSQNESWPTRAPPGEAPTPSNVAVGCWKQKGEQRFGSDSYPWVVPALPLWQQMSLVPVLSPLAPMGERSPEAPLFCRRQALRMAGKFLPHVAPKQSDPLGSCNMPLRGSEEKLPGSVPCPPQVVLLLFLFLHVHAASGR